MTQTLRIAVHPDTRNKDKQPAYGWLNIAEDLDYLLAWVKAGHAWCATWFADKHRATDNSDGSNVVAVDIDGDCTLEAFWQTHFAKTYCAATYTSCSHSEESHRFRAIFLLESQLETPPAHKAAYFFVVNQLLPDLGLEKLKDDSGAKPERLWYGNNQAQIQKNLEALPVPADVLATLEIEEPTHYEGSGEATETDIERCKYLLEQVLRPSEDGEYETLYTQVLVSCASIGDVVFDSWVTWVLKGHHGHKPENIKRFKWKGLRGGTFATLYKLAKEQDPAWKSKLPSQLSFRAKGNAVGYLEADPTPDFSALVVQDTGSPKPESLVSFEVEPEPIPEPPKTSGRKRKGEEQYVEERLNDLTTVKACLPNLRFNQLTNAVEYDERGQVVVMEGNAKKTMTYKLVEEHGRYIPEARIVNAIDHVAQQNAYCPVRQYLAHCEANVDPSEHWDSCGQRYLGEGNPERDLVLKRLMIGAVARAMNPGCSMSWLPILVGAQGTGKSQFVRNLVPDAFFAEISTPLELLSKEQYRLHTGWLLELPEVDAYFSVKNIENFKNLVTTRVDETRRPYEPDVAKLRRRFVFIGTSNRNQFLVDATGNRRFVPLELAPNFLVPWAQLAKERDSLWAAAIKAYRNNETYEFTSGEIAKLAPYINQFAENDPWEEQIIDHIEQLYKINKGEIESDGRLEVSPANILSKALNLDAQRQTRTEQRRVTSVLQTLGFRKFERKERDEKTGKRKTVRPWQISHEQLTDLFTSLTDDVNDTDVF